MIMKVAVALAVDWKSPPEGPKPIFINGYWRARVNGITQPHCHFTYAEAEAACK